MMNPLRARPILLLAMILVAGTASAQPAATETAITRKVQAYFTAMGKGDVATVERELAPDYLVIGGDGKLETRTERLAWMRKNTASLASITPTQVRVRVYGSAAVATGLVTIPADKAGPAIEERFTQVWVQRDSAWRMVSGQITIVRK